MSVEVTNETVWQIDGKVFSDLGIWVMDQMRGSNILRASTAGPVALSLLARALGRFV